MSNKSTPKTKGRQTGVPNYKKDILLNIIENILPSSSDDWMQVAIRYQDASGEVKLRDPYEIKRQFTQKLCNKGLKPTGNSGEKSRILKAQRIYQKIFDKNESFNLGDEDDEYYPSEEEEDDDDDEEEVEIEEESEVVHQSSPTLPEKENKRN
jgi:hypothetical protein